MTATNTANPDRVRLNEPALQTEADVNNALYRFGVNVALIKQWKLRLKLIKAAITKIVQGRIDKLAEQNGLLKLQVADYLLRKKADFASPNPRSQTLTFGKIGWRKAPSAKLVADEDAEMEIMNAIEQCGSEEAYDAIKVTIKGTYRELRDVVDLLRKSGRGDLFDRTIAKEPLKALPEEMHKRLGVELSTEDAPFMTPALEAVIENAGIAVKLDIVDEPTNADVEKQLGELLKG